MRHIILPTLMVIGFMSMAGAATITEEVCSTSGGTTTISITTEESLTSSSVIQWTDNGTTANIGSSYTLSDGNKTISTMLTDTSPCFVGVLSVN